MSDEHVFGRNTEGIKNNETFGRKVDDKEKARRVNPRARCSFKALCVTTAKQRFAGKVTNISVGGLQVQVPTKLNPKDKLYLEISCFYGGMGRVIKVVGETVHSHLIASVQVYDVGLKFATKLGEKDILCIKNYVKNTLKK